jgi:hypothetical protein
MAKNVITARLLCILATEDRVKQVSNHAENITALNSIIEFLPKNINHSLIGEIRSVVKIVIDNRVMT